MSGSNDTSKRIIKIVVLATILILPGFLYYLLEREGKNRYKSLPVYGAKELTGTFSKRMGKEIPDTLFHQLTSFKAVNQESDTLLVLSESANITVVNFFYTRCETFCDLLLKEMDRVATRFANNQRVDFYSMTVDTVYDRPAILKQYSDGLAPQAKKWNFLTSPFNTLEVIRRGFLVDALEDPSRPGIFIHSSSFVLLDSKRRIRGYYDVNHPKEIDRLIDEIKLLLVEEIRLNDAY